MDRAEYLAEYCENKKCDKPDCNNCMYEKGRSDMIDEVINIFENRKAFYTQEEILNVLYFLKEQNNDK